MLKVLQSIYAYFLALTKASIYIKIAESKTRNSGNTDGRQEKYLGKPKKHQVKQIEIPEETVGSS